jgi:hypothetical protein
MGDNISMRNKICTRAAALIREHFDALSALKLDVAKGHLFFPREMNDRPLDVYVQAMSRLAPFQHLSISIDDFEEIRKKRHGDVATVWIRIAVDCSLGHREALLTVWWFPEIDAYKIATRPTGWVLERLDNEKKGVSKT